MRLWCEVNFNGGCWVAMMCCINLVKRRDPLKLQTKKEKFGGATLIRSGASAYVRVVITDQIIMNLIIIRP